MVRLVEGEGGALRCDRPVGLKSSSLARLVSRGRLMPARLDLLSLGRPPAAPLEISISEALKEQRSER